MLKFGFWAKITRLFVGLVQICVDRWQCSDLVPEHALERSVGTKSRLKCDCSDGEMSVRLFVEPPFNFLYPVCIYKVIEIPLYTLLRIVETVLAWIPTCTANFCWLSSASRYDFSVSIVLQSNSNCFCISSDTTFDWPIELLFMELIRWYPIIPPIQKA